MAYTRRSFSGYAVVTTLASAVGASDTTLSIVASTGWPDGSSGKFYVRIDPGLSTEEKVLVTTRSSTTLQSVSRGQDGTAASAHSAGATVECCFAAVDLDEANYWVAELSGAATTAGDLPVADAANSLTKIAKGSNSTVFGVDANSTLGYATLTSAQITDDTLVNADFNSSAGIALSKLESIATGYVVGNNSGSSASPSTVAISGTTLRVGSNRTVTDVLGSSTYWDPTLTFPMTNGAIYEIDLAVVVAMATGSGVYPWLFVHDPEVSPPGTLAGGFVFHWYVNGAGTTYSNSYTSDVPCGDGFQSTSTKRVYRGTGVIVGDGNTFKIGYAISAGGDTLTVYAGSYLRYRQIA